MKNACTFLDRKKKKSRVIHKLSWIVVLFFVSVIFLSMFCFCCWLCIVKQQHLQYKVTLTIWTASVQLHWARSRAMTHRRRRGDKITTESAFTIPSVLQIHWIYFNIPTICAVLFFPLKRSNITFCTANIVSIHSIKFVYINQSIKTINLHFWISLNFNRCETLKKNTKQKWNKIKLKQNRTKDTMKRALSLNSIDGPLKC